MNLNDTIEHWLTHIQQTRAPVNRPFVTLSYAQGLDGSIALRSCEPLALSGDNSLRLTHQLRSLHDGILVGVGTVISDDPQLNVRHWSGKNPQPIILDTQLRTPGDARLRQCAEKPCWILTTQEEQSTDAGGAEICLLKPGEDGRVCLQNALSLLHEKGIRQLMVEGGAKVITAFLKAGFVDAVVITVVPTFVGGYKAVNDLGVHSRVELPRIHPFNSERLNNDLIIWGELNYPKEKS